MRNGLCVITNKQCSTGLFSCKDCEIYQNNESTNLIKIGDKVIMNDKYYVSESNKNKEFIVKTEMQEVCGTMSVWLEGFRGCYAVDGLKDLGVAMQ